MIKTILKYLGWIFLIHIVYSIVRTVLSQLGIVPIATHPTVNHINENIAEPFALGLIFFTSAILHPIEEEFCFRMMITRNKNFFFIGTGLMMVMISIIFFHWQFIGLIFPSEVIIVLLLLTTALFASLLFRLIFHSIKFEPEKYIQSITLISSLLFAVAHIHVTGGLSRFSVFFIFPYFLIGLVLSKVKIKYGLKYSILLHILNNSFMFLFNIFLRIGE